MSRVPARSRLRLRRRFDAAAFLESVVPCPQCQFPDELFDGLHVQCLQSVSSVWAEEGGAGVLRGCFVEGGLRLGEAGKRRLVKGCTKKGSICALRLADNCAGTVQRPLL